MTRLPSSAGVANRRARPLTELEGTVLGLVWVFQPCTPYRVRRDFLDSPSPHWSGSAGAIYPLMTRLERAGLLHSGAHATGGRGSRRYSLTPAGRRALQRWIGPPLAAEALGVPPDPLRMRIASLALLPPARRRRWLREVMAGVRAQLERTMRDEQDVRPGAARFDFMRDGALAMQKARLEWLRRVARSLDSRGEK